MGAILAQKDSKGRERIIRAFSKILDKAQLKCSITDREFLAIIKFLQHSRHYSLVKEFILRTDHKAIAYL
ncbi:hypothetical protein PAEPH01_1666 [Pancytospora epiphaga]|nr:hypothetical protein PAEPH01_1666 [Pancytospora epiphaga]